MKGQERLGLWLIILLSVALAMWFAARVPFDGSNPDETSHLDYIHLLYEHKGLVHVHGGRPGLL